MKLWQLHLCILAAVAAAFVAFAFLSSAPANVKSDCAKKIDDAILRSYCRDFGLK